MSGIRLNLGWQHAVLISVFLGSFALMLSVDAIPQDQGYHRFADSRAWLGIPNFFDVGSNLPFLLVGTAGIILCGRLSPGVLRTAWVIFFAGVALVSAGSAWYHWNPSDTSLVWDRLPMTVGFMGLFVALIGEHLGERLAGALLVPALLLGLSSVLYWYWQDDLRLYIWIQMAPVITVPALILLFPGRHTHRWMLVVALVCYLAAKALEVYDAAVFSLVQGLVSGHTLKHLAAALSTFSIFLMLMRRRPLRQA